MDRIPSEQQLKKSFTATLPRWLGVIVGAAVLVFGIRDLQRAAASQQWPAVAGIIAHTQIRSSYDADRGKTEYSPEIEYTYEVAGRQYTGTQLRFGELLSGSWCYADDQIDRYPKGKQVTVWYMPDDPGVAVLEPGTSWTMYLVPVAGIFIVIFGVSRRDLWRWFLR